VFTPHKPFQPTFAEVRSLPQREAFERGSGLSGKYEARLKRLFRGKHSSLFCLIVGDEEKQTFYNTGHRRDAPTPSDGSSAEGDAAASGLRTSAATKRAAAAAGDA
jgi:hypothetical protein